MKEDGRGKKEGRKRTGRMDGEEFPYIIRYRGKGMGRKSERKKRGWKEKKGQEKGERGGVKKDRGERKGRKER